MRLIQKLLWLVKEAVVVVVGRGGGSKYYGHYKMTPPPTAEYRCYLASPVCSFEWFIHIHSISMPLIHKTLWLVKEAVVVVVGGGSKYYGHYKMTPPPPQRRIQDVTSLALFVHLSGLFISFYFHAFNT